jgi:carbamoyltransferase
MKEYTYILGVHDGHNCGASLALNGKIISSVSEERLTRKKNEVGYPYKSIEECLKIANIEASDLYQVVLASNFMHHPSYLEDMQPWYLVGEKEQKIDKKKSKHYQKEVFYRRKRERINNLVKHLQIDENNICFIEHHLAHLAAAYYTAPNVAPNKPILGLTCDGAGDGLSATVSLCKNNSIKRIKSSDRHASLGKIYSRITMLLGMKPWEHEYKIMGLAPYSDSKIANEEAKKLHHLLKLSNDGLGFKLNTPLSTNYCYYYLRDAFERVRFDNISGAVQSFTEEMLVKWVKSAIKKTKIRDIVCGGGVFMNVKANMLIQNLPEVKSMYVMPSASDESLSIGAALHYYYNNKKSLMLLMVIWKIYI